jgi:PleD family two-component response regulator
LSHGFIIKVISGIQTSIKMKTDSMHHGSILVVDDSPLLLDYINEIFKSTGYTMYFDADGKQLFEILEKHPIDLILLDIILPEIDGYQLCTKIKHHPKFKEIPVIFLSSLVNTEDIIKAFSEGGVDYIKKPFEPQELIIRAKKHIELKRADDTYRLQLNQLRESNRYLMGTMHELSKMWSNAGRPV